MLSTTSLHRMQRVRAVEAELVLVLLAAALTACGLNRAEVPEEEDVPEPTIEEVQERHTPAWMELPGVVGTGIGLCDREEGADPPREPCIRVFLAEPSPQAEEAIPERVEGFRVELVVTGPIRPRPDSVLDSGTT